MIKSLSIFLYIFAIFQICISTDQIYVDSSKSYSLACGSTLDLACSDILSGLAAYGNLESKSDSLILSLVGGVYSGTNNSFINILNQDITITSLNSNSLATIDLQFLNSFISIKDVSATGNTNTNLTLSNLNIINGNSSTNGTVVNISTQWTPTLLTFDSVYVAGNLAFEGYGGVIYVQTSVANTKIVLTNSTFFNNTAYLGAVYYSETQGQLEISKSVIKNNVGVITGIVDAYQTSVSVTNSTVAYNLGRSAIFTFISNVGTVEVSNLIAYNNSLRSNWDGGFIQANENNLSVLDSDFQWNSGSAVIYFETEGSGSYQLLVGTSVFNETMGSRYGGAIYVCGGSSNIYNSSFIENYSIYNGGAIYYSDTLQANATNLIFINNQVGVGNGSSIYTNNATVNYFDNLSFINSNNITTAMYCNSSSIYLNNITNDNVTPLISCDSTKPSDQCTIHSSNNAIGQQCNSQVNSSDNNNNNSSEHHNNNNSSGDNKKPKKKGLTSAQIGGIAAGSAVGAAAIVLGVYIIHKRHHNRNKYKSYY
ncbi:hypothetical protein PPL_03572 [Heterostelium album PN500]|uniref:Uncharacterized protein n=1 Tax=Heterostelium pallidum (strain ATCC 26659 / Pp 5 / PN500) TaxID=670386 RepID=D3B561_HETP5|nr:hypothetical protein PPL_03572 [Heterostelium album PN500]EFA83426.1 hypothetical protein PPL_03572 [Heterostelium album PN500]|eukprot:XP_020435543.1 hypothetical protein PPL_03572 [Heterostelium album PN500]